jgi:hypothetical protein
MKPYYKKNYTTTTTKSKSLTLPFIVEISVTTAVLVEMDWLRLLFLVNKQQQQLFFCCKNNF